MLCVLGLSLIHRSVSMRCGTLSGRVAAGEVFRNVIKTMVNYNTCVPQSDLFRFTPSSVVRGMRPKLLIMFAPLPEDIQIYVQIVKNPRKNMLLIEPVRREGNVRRNWGKANSKIT